MSSGAVLTQTIETIAWTSAGVIMINQTRLPRETVYAVECIAGGVLVPIRLLADSGTVSVDLPPRRVVVLEIRRSDRIGAGD